MPEKKKYYSRVIFTQKIIKEAEATMLESLPKGKGKLESQLLHLKLPSGEEWSHTNEDEFFADYNKGFSYVHLDKDYDKASFELVVYDNNTNVSVALQNRADVEKVFNIFESHVEKCRLPKQPRTKTEAKTDWITETINKIEGRCPMAGHKLKSALIKLDSEEIEEWQNAAMLIRDAWIELAQWLCQVNNIDTTDIEADAVIDRLRKLKIHKTDDRLFNLARASFNLSAKHHKRDIDQDSATACVVSTIVSMQTVIREVFNATG
jgi:hypothetical protein